jgi:hypothetical protein
MCNKFYTLVLQILQNHLLIGVWVLITGLQTQLSASSFLTADKGKDDKGKSPNKLREGSSRINLMKVLVACILFVILLFHQFHDLGLIDLFSFPLESLYIFFSTVSVQ